MGVTKGDKESLDSNSRGDYSFLEVAVPYMSFSLNSLKGVV